MDVEKPPFVDHFLRETIGFQHLCEVNLTHIWVNYTWNIHSAEHKNKCMNMVIVTQPVAKTPFRLCESKVQG